MDKYIGYRFQPSDEEIITQYLNKKIDNNNAKVFQISDVNFYSHEPEELSRQYPRVNQNDEVWYFYHPPDSKVKRTTNAGFWKVSGKESKIFVRGEEIGTQQLLIFYKGSIANPIDTPWVMNEFRSKKIIPSNKKAYVVCRLQKKAKSGK